MMAKSVDLAILMHNTYHGDGYKLRNHPSAPTGGEDAELSLDDTCTKQRHA